MPNIPRICNRLDNYIMHIIILLMTTHNFLFPGEVFSLLVAILPIKSNQKRMHVIDLGQIVYINIDQNLGKIKTAQT